MNNTNGIKHDNGKLDWTLLPYDQLEPVVRVLEFGAQKYSRDNWKLVPDARFRYIKAAFRHFVAWFREEKKDPESGESHLAHVVCCVLFAMYFEKE